MNRHIVVLVTGSFLLAGFPVQASQSAADKALAKTLYLQAAEDMERGAYDRACPQFEAALQLDPEHIRTAMTLGMCESNWGKLVQARSRLDYARKLAVNQSAAEKVTEIDGLLADLNKRIPKLRIVVPAKLAGEDDLSIARNGAFVAQAEWGKDVGVDPGEYVIKASIPGHGSWTTNVRLQVGQTVEVTIVLPAPGSAWKADDSVGAKRPISRTVGFVGIGLGTAGLLAGSILGGLAISKNSASDDGHCNADSYCDPTGMALRLDAQAYGNGSTALFVVGGVLAAGGIVLVATSSGTSKQNHATKPAVVRVGLGQVQFETSW